MADVWQMYGKVDYFFSVFFSFFYHATEFLPDFSSVLLYGCQNCKVHYSEDIISGQPAKTVLQNMQMRARTDAYKNRPFCYSFCYSMSNIADNH